MVAFLRYNHHSKIFTLGDVGEGRGNGTTLARNCRNQELISIKMRSNRMIFSNISKCKGQSRRNAFAIHKQTVKIVALVRRYSVSN